MTNQWYPSPETLDDFPCAKQRVTKELCLASKRGQIWIYSDELIAILLQSPRSAKKVVETYQVGGFLGLTDGEEIQIKLPRTELKKVAQLLAIPKTRPKQCRILNRGR